MSVTTCRACCPSCGLHFASNGAFDAHLSLRGHRQPLDVKRKDRSEALAVKTSAGECRLGGKTLAPVVVWEMAGAREKAAKAFRQSAPEDAGEVAPSPASPAYHAAKGAGSGT